MIAHIECRNVGFSIPEFKNEQGVQSMTFRCIHAMVFAAALTLPGVAAADGSLLPEPRDTILGTGLFDDLPDGVLAIGRDEEGSLYMLSVPPRDNGPSFPLLPGPVIVEPRVTLPSDGWVKP
jgi:hypothetical protein